MFRKGEPNPAQRAEQRAALSVRRKGSKASEETRRKRSETMKRLLRKKDWKEKWSKAKLGTKLSVAVKKKIRETKKRKPKKLVTMLHYMDQAFSIYIRLKYSDLNGNVRCFTCDSTKPVAEMDCGHFVSRIHKATRWSEENAHAQCRYCNRYCEGRKDVYALRLVEKYGQEILSRLQVAKHRVVHIDEEMYELFMAEMKQKREALTEQIVPGWKEQDASARKELEAMGLDLYQGAAWWKLPPLGMTAGEQAQQMAEEYEPLTAGKDYT